MGSSRAADSLFDQVDLFASSHARSLPALRQLLEELWMDIAEARKSREHFGTRLDSFQLSLSLRSETTESADVREAIAMLLKKAVRLQQELRAVDRLCDAALQLHGDCQDMLGAGHGLIEVLQDKVEPAWEHLMASATTLHGAQAFPDADRISRVTECTAEYENWLEEAMRACLVLRGHCDGAQHAIGSMRA